MKTPLDESASSFLIQASLLYKDKCPELSRHLLQGPIEVNGPSRKSSPSVCSFCYQWLQPDNHRVRVRPKRRPSAQVQRVLRRQVQGKHLSLMQKDLLQRFYKSSSVLMATCHTCNRASRHKGMSRDFIMSRCHGTPGSSGKHKTPQSVSRSNTTTLKTGGKDKTPVHTPRASISSTTPGSGSSSCKSPAAKGKNWVVQRLSKMLMREDNPGKKKGGLKDFLSSL
ncbi:UPF0711 protein C18orf21 homolog [Eucyclogobius newberryi]|uniref:UPF0711 protein C18orf21 homolog n=1 Tax=Eucyclogobius newberryi TaxID=166745 RepID=UPI003B5A5618